MVEQIHSDTRDKDAKISIFNLVGTPFRLSINKYITYIMSFIVLF